MKAKTKGMVKMKRKQKWNPGIVIYCTDPSNVSGLDFYMRDKNREHFLFRQPYRKSTYDYFHTGVRLEKAMDFSKAGNNHMITCVMRRIPSALKYLASIDEIQILEHRRLRKCA